MRFQVPECCFRYSSAHLVEVNPTATPSALIKGSKSVFKAMYVTHGSYAAEWSTYGRSRADILPLTTLKACFTRELLLVKPHKNNFNTFSTHFTTFHVQEVH